MEKVLRPERLDVSPNTVDAPRAWRHWLATFENFIESLQRPDENLDKLRILTNFVAPEIYELFSDFNNYDEAIAKLKATVSSFPSGYRTCAYCGFASIKCTSSVRGSNFEDRT